MPCQPSELRLGIGVVVHFDSDNSAEEGWYRGSVVNPSDHREGWWRVQFAPAGLRRRASAMLYDLSTHEKVAAGATEGSAERQARHGSFAVGREVELTDHRGRALVIERNRTNDWMRVRMLEGGSEVNCKLGDLVTNDDSHASEAAAPSTAKCATERRIAAPRSCRNSGTRPETARDASIAERVEVATRPHEPSIASDAVAGAAADPPVLCESGAAPFTGSIPLKLTVFANHCGCGGTVGAHRLAGRVV